jgi:hypothetical protein
MSAIDLAIDGSGNFYVAHSIFAGTLRADTSNKSFTLVSVYNHAGEVQKPLVQLTRADLERDSLRYNLPGPVPLVLTANGDRVAVGFPAAGVVDVFRSYSHVTTAQVCVPQQTRAGYKRQLTAATSRTRSQSWVPLLVDVVLRSDGQLATISQLPDTAGRNHVDIFRTDGTAGLTLTFSKNTFPTSGFLRFAGTDSRLVLAESDGGVRTFGWIGKEAQPNAGR